MAACKTKRMHFTLNTKTLDDLRYVKDAFRVSSRAAAVDWAIRYTVKLIRAVLSGQILLLYDTKSATVAPVDFPGQDLAVAGAVAAKLREVPTGG